MVSLLGRKLAVVYHGLGWVQLFEFALGWVGLGWISQMMGRVGSGHRKLTHSQLCFVVMTVLSTLGHKIPVYDPLSLCRVHIETGRPAIIKVKKLGRRQYELKLNKVAF